MSDYMERAVEAAANMLEERSHYWIRKALTAAEPLIAEHARQEERKRVEEALLRVFEHQETIAMTADSEALHLELEENSEGKREAELVAVIAKNTLRHLRATLQASAQPEEEDGR